VPPSGGRRGSQDEKKFETEIYSLKGEIGCLKFQLFWANRREKHLEEKLNLSLNPIPSSVSAKQVHKLIQYVDPETWDGDIWDSDDNGELEENSDYDLASEPIPIPPLIKRETTEEGEEQACTTVRTTPWSPAELAKFQEKYSRRPGESETEYVCRVSLTGGD